MQVERVLKYLTVGGVYALPFIVFIVSNATFFPFIFGKNMAFRVLVEVIFVAWVALAAINHTYRPRISAASVAVAVFVGIVALAALFGADPAKSFWSNFERMEGLVTILHLFAYMLVAASVFAHERIGLWFWRISLAVASVVSLHTVIQFLETGKQRLDSTLGNPIYLAVYALFHIFIALILLARRGAHRNEQIFYILVLPLQFWVLFMTATRGATLGVLGGIALALIGIACTYRAQRHARILAAGVVALIVLGIGLFIMAKDTSFVAEHPVLKRFASISFTEGTVFARTVVWSIAWEGVKERPLLGWGQDNFNLVFNKHYDPRMYAQEPWFDRTHNAVFDWLIAAGVLGLLAYISIFLALLWLIYNTQNVTLVQKWLLVGLLAAYGFHNLTVFDQISSYILFFSLIAWITAIAHDVKGVQLWECYREFAPSWRVVLCVVVGIAVVVTLHLSSASLRTNTLLLQALQDAGTAEDRAARGDTERARLMAEESLTKFTEAANLNTFGTQEVHELAAQTAARFSRVDWMSEDSRTQWLNFAAEGLIHEEMRSEGDARPAVFLARLYWAFGEHELEREALLRAYAISPQKQNTLLSLGINAMHRGDIVAAREFVEKAYELEPSYVKAGILYASALLLTDSIDDFVSMFGDTSFVGADKRILSLLVERGEHELASSLWEAAFQRTLAPETAFVLGGVYAQVGDTKRAAESIRRVREIDARAQEQADALLRSLGE